MQLPSASSEQLILAPSISRMPRLSVFAARSEPARSTSESFEKRRTPPPSPRARRRAARRPRPRRPTPHAAARASASAAVASRVSTAIWSTACERLDSELAPVASCVRRALPRWSSSMIASTDVAATSVAPAMHGPRFGSSWSSSPPGGPLRPRSSSRSLISSLYTSMNVTVYVDDHPPSPSARASSWSRIFGMMPSTPGFPSIVCASARESARASKRATRATTGGRARARARERASNRARAPGIGARRARARRRHTRLARARLAVREHGRVESVEHGVGERRARAVEHVVVRRVAVEHVVEVVAAVAALVRAQVIDLLLAAGKSFSGSSTSTSPRAVSISTAACCRRSCPSSGRTRTATFTWKFFADFFTMAPAPTPRLERSSASSTSKRPRRCSSGFNRTRVSRPVKSRGRLLDRKAPSRPPLCGFP